MMRSPLLASCALVLATVTAGPAVGDAVPVAPFTGHDATAHGEVTQIRVTYAAAGEEIPGWLVLPAGTDRRPAVLFAHSGFGVDQRVQRRARELAEAGYVVLAPEYRPLDAPRFTITPGEMERFLAADSLLRKHERVDAGRVAVIGSSHGSLVALLAVAESPPRHFRCAVHACGNRGARDRAADIHCPVLVQVGRQDREAEYQQARFMGIDLRHSGNSAVDIREYTLAGHDMWFWTDPETFTADEILQGQWAWDDAMAFLGRHLNPRGLTAR